jgi:hypothetical protein
MGQTGVDLALGRALRPPATSGDTQTARSKQDPDPMELHAVQNSHESTPSAGAEIARYRGYRHAGTLPFACLSPPFDKCSRIEHNEAP